MTSSRWRDDRGQVAGIESIPFAILLFVVGSLLIVNAWAVIDAKMAANAAAREATRTYVEASNHDEGVVAADRAARDSLAAYGRDPNVVVVDGPTDPSAFVPCARATFTVRYQVPAITLPFIGGFGNGVTVSATDTELIDPATAGAPGQMTCA